MFIIIMYVYFIFYMLYISYIFLFLSLYIYVCMPEISLCICRCLLKEATPAKSIALGCVGMFCWYWLANNFLSHAMIALTVTSAFWAHGLAKLLKMIDQDKL